MYPVKSIYRFFSLLMAGLILVSTIGFSVDRHYCQGELKSVSFLGKAKSCHEVANTVRQCPHHPKATSSTKEKEEPNGCCENESQFFQADLDKIAMSFELELQQSLSSFLSAAIGNFLPPAPPVTTFTAFTLYKPPLIPKDVPILIQSFLL